MSSLLDQSPLVDLAQRLVEAARRAGADAADAVAVRSASLAVEVRDAAVEESERAEADDLGLRVLVGRRQEVVSTNDLSEDGVANLAERAVAMARAAPDDPFAGLADPELLAKTIPDLDLADPELPSVARLEALALEAEAAAVSVKGVTKSAGASAGAGIGGMVLVTRSGFSGAYLGSQHSLAMTAIAGNGTAIARHTSFLQDKLGESLFRPGIGIVDDPLRRRGLRSRPFDAEGVAGRPIALVQNGVLKSWLLDCATARELGQTTTGHAQRGVSSAPSPGPTNLHLEPGARTPQALIGGIGQGFYVTDLIGMGVNFVTGDYSRGAAGFWIENGELTYPVSEVTIAGDLIEMFRTLEPANDLVFRYGTNAPTLRVEGMTVAGH